MLIISYIISYYNNNSLYYCMSVSVVTLCAYLAHSKLWEVYVLVSKSPVVFIVIRSGAVTVASADEVTGVWSVNHILKLSSQQVAGKGEGLGELNLHVVI